MSQDEQGPLVSLADIAKMAGVSRPAVSNWRRRYDDFPEPVQETGATSLFQLVEIERWMRGRGKPFVVPSVEQQVWSAFAIARGALLPEDAAHVAMVLLGMAVVADGLGSADRAALDDALQSEHPDRLAAELERLTHKAAWLGLHDDSVGAVDARLIRLCLPFLLSIDELAREYGPGQVFEALVAMLRRSSRGGGEHGSPPAIAKLIASLAEPIRGTVYDPACGRGGFLYAAHQRVEPGADVQLVGRELDSTAYQTAQLRLLTHGVNAKVFLGDTLASSASADPRVDLVLADPPFGMWWQPGGRTHHRHDLPFGVPPPSRADLAWLQYSIIRLRPTGMAFHITALGPLFRTGAEADIRRQLVTNGLVHAVIALPAGLYGPQTGIPVAMWIVGRQRSPAGHAVLFMDATRMGARMRGRAELSDADIGAIVERYRAWRDTSRSGRTIDDVGDGGLRHRTIGVDRILDQDCSLHPARWLDDHPDDPRQDIEVVRTVETKLQSTHDTLAGTGHLDVSAVLRPSEREVPSMSVREMVDRRLLTVTRARRVNPALIGSGDTPLIRSQDLADDLSVASSGGIDPGFLGYEPVMSEPGDVIVLAAGTRPRAAVDHSGGAIVAAPLYLLRWSTTEANPLVMAALITRVIERYSAGIAMPRAPIHSLELPILDAESSKWLANTLRALLEQRRLASVIADASRELADRLVDSLGSGRTRARVPTPTVGHQQP